LSKETQLVPQGICTTERMSRKFIRVKSTGGRKPSANNSSGATQQQNDQRKRDFRIPLESRALDLAVERWAQGAPRRVGPCTCATRQAGTQMRQQSRARNARTENTQTAGGQNGSDSSGGCARVCQSLMCRRVEKRLGSGLRSRSEGDESMRRRERV